MAGIMMVAIQALEDRTTDLESQRARIVVLQQRNDDLGARLTALEQTLGLTEASSAPLSFDNSVIWIIGAGLGLVMGGSGLVLGHRKFRGSITS